jgi:hypothetical protein
MRLTFALATVLYVSALSVVSTQQTPSAPPATRFDFEVRADFFAGFAGDTARFERAMKRCEDALADNPKHAEAMVWHGAGLLGQGGMLMGKGDMPKGLELWKRGLDEMNRAVELEPDNVGVRIPRGAALFETSRHVPPQMAPPLLKLALDDYEHTLMLQKPHFARLSDHAKGELLFGLAEGWSRAGDAEKARGYFMRLTKDAPKSGRVAYSKAWLDGKPPAEVGTCVGCH